MNSITLYYRAEGKDKSTGYIHVRFYLHREKVPFSTKVPVEVKHWDQKKMRVTVADKLSADKNLILENILARINNIFVKYRLKNKILTKNAFLRAYARPDDFDDFYAFCDNYKKETVSKRVEQPTLNTHKTVLDKLKAFAPDLHFDDITLEFVESFYSHLRKKKKNNENTSYKNMAVLRKYVRAAIKAGYMDENPFDEYHILRTKANYTYLEENELKDLIQLYKTGDLELKYYKTLQFFLFMCFGSQHIGDAKQMKIEDFGKDSFVYWRLKTRNSKPEPIYVPISKAMRTLLNEIVGHRKKGLVFDALPADQSMNKYLKTIAELAGIKKKISHKTARHTFATFYLAKTSDLNTLREIMGHSDIRETLIYAHVLECNRQRGIKSFDVFKMGA